MLFVNGMNNAAHASARLQDFNLKTHHHRVRQQRARDNNNDYTACPVALRPKGRINNRLHFLQARFTTHQPPIWIIFYFSPAATSRTLRIKPFIRFCFRIKKHYRVLSKVDSLGVIVNVFISAGGEKEKKITAHFSR